MDFASGRDPQFAAERIASQRQVAGGDLRAGTALPELPEGYFLLDFKTLNELVQINNTMNIQLRNLLSLLEA